mmetsp:Transcript_11221/g.18306  ORF Transcript_11221/g.18306 Transcript_11221/m.18306 type:complete len:341 (-) Transcript_11221:709-1731(-)
MRRIIRAATQLWGGRGVGPGSLSAGLRENAAAMASMEKLLAARRAFGRSTHEEEHEALLLEGFDGVEKHDLNTAYEIQAAISNELMLDGDAKVLGYKVANTNPTSQKYLGIDHPFFGPILSNRIEYGSVKRPQPPMVRSSSMNERMVELEIGFQLARDLPPKEDGSDYSLDEIKDSISYVVPCIEIVHSSFANWKKVGAAALIADLCSNGAFVLGQPREKKGSEKMNPLKDDVLLRATHEQLDGLKDELCELYVDNGIESRGKGSNALGDPVEVVRWLANNIHKQPSNTFLKADQFVSTGVITNPPYYFIYGNEQIRADFSTLGSVHFITSDPDYTLDDL